jgi:hypothetical protein
MAKYHSTPNNDRSRSLNKQDSWGKAAEANHDGQVAENEASESSE